MTMSCGISRYERTPGAAAHDGRDRANRVREVARILDTSERQIWRLIEQGRIRAERHGPRTVRIWDSEIARFRAACAAE
jgi:excisionase family DNA binding protein